MGCLGQHGFCCFLQKRKPRRSLPDELDEDLCLHSDWSRELRDRLRVYGGPIETKSTTHSSSLLVNFSGESFIRSADYSAATDRNLSFRKMEPISLDDAERLDWTESRRMLEEALDMNKDVVSYVMSGDERLSQRLSSFGLRLDIQKGDGNCQFRALSKQLFGDAERHPIVRQRAIRYMEQHRARFEPYLGPDFDRYLSDMAATGTWGDELTLRASSEAFHCMITVITSERTNWFVRYIPEGELKGEVFLAFHSPCHYNALARGKKKK